MPDSSELSSQDFFSKLSNSRQHLIALLILFLVPFVLFTASTIGGKEFQRHDITQWRAGAESVIEYREAYDTEPLWVSNMFGGMPAYVVSVKNVVPHLDWMPILMQGIYPAAQFWVLLSGIYFLLVMMNFRSLSSVFGSLMFGLATYIPIIIVAGHNSKFIALTYAPWMIAGYWLLSRHPKKIPGLLLFSVALCLELRAGHPQITYYFFYLLGVLWVVDTWSAYKEHRMKVWVVTTLLLVIGGVIGILGYANKLLPLQEYAQYSIRGGSALENSTGLSSSYAFAWSQGIKETLTLWIPNLFGGASPDYWGGKSFTSGPHYIGALSLPFILLALLRQRSKIMYAFFAAGTLGVLFSWGGNFRLLNEFAFDYIPYFDKFRAPETWLIFTAFCYSVVAVYGLEWLINYSRSKQPRLKTLYVPLGISATLAVLFFFQVSTAEYTRPGETQQIARQIAQQNQMSPDNAQVVRRAQTIVTNQLVPNRAEKAKSDVLRFTILLVLGIALMYLCLTHKIPQSAVLIGFFLILAVDMISVDKRYIPESVFVSGNVDPERTLESQRRDIDTYIQDHISEGTNYPYRVFPLLDNPYSEARPAYFYPIIGGYSGAKLSLIQDVMYGGGPLDVQRQNFNPQLLDLFNVKYITYVEGLPLPGFEAVYQSSQGVVYENNNVLPKAFFADSLITATNPRDAFEYLKPGRVDLSKTAIVETDRNLETAADTSSMVQVTSYNGVEMSLEVQRSKPGFLVLSEVYYPAGWKATLDGEEIPIYKTDYFLRGFEIPSGNHTLELTFEPDTYQLGLKLAWTSLVLQLLLAGFWGFTYYKDHRELDS